MTERAYTVAEIDALRRTVRQMLIWGSYSGPPRQNAMSRGYNDQDVRAMTEEMVRTHMLAGHTAEDLIASEK